MGANGNHDHRAGAAGASPALARRTNGAAPDLTQVAPLQLRSLADVIELGRVLAATGYFKDVRDAGQAVAKILYGMELGIGPMGSMMGVHIIEGKPSPSANLMATLIKKSRRYNYRVSQWDTQICVIDFFEDGQPCGQASFTLDEAKAANVAGKDVWRKYPKAMLFARAMAQGARTFCADVFGGAPVYTAEELGAAVDVTAEGEVVYQPPAPERVDTTAGEIVGEAVDVPNTAPVRQVVVAAGEEAAWAKLTRGEGTAPAPDELRARFETAVAACGRDLGKTDTALTKKYGRGWAGLTADEQEHACEVMEAEAESVQG